MIFVRIRVIIAFLKSAGTQSEKSELHMIGRRRMTMLSVICLVNTRDISSRNEPVGVLSRSEVSRNKLSNIDRSSSWVATGNGGLFKRPTIFKP